MMGQQNVENARRSGDAVHCVYVDIDQLRHVNEVSGHEAVTTSSLPSPKHSGHYLRYRHRRPMGR